MFFLLGDGRLSFSVFRFNERRGGKGSRVFVLAIAAVLFVTADPVEGADGGGQGELSGQDGAGDYFGEFFDFSSAGTAQELETFPLCRQGGAAAVGGDDERWDGNRDVEVLFVGEFDVDDAGRRFGHVGHVLAGGDENGGDGVGGVEAVVVDACEDGTDVGDAVVVEELLRLDAHVLDEDVAGYDRFGGDALAAGAHDVDLGGFFVGGEVGLEVEALDLLAVVVIEDPGTGGEGCAAHHVLSASVACLVVEAEKGEFV